jgi:TIGR03009 family protein
MKPLASTIVAVLLTTGAAFAQAPPAGAPPKDAPPPSIGAAMSEKNKESLDAYLAAWEKRMSKIDHLETRVVFTEVSTGPEGRSTKFVRTGDAAILKPNYARMLLKPADDPANTKRWMHFVADGEFFRHYDYTSKVVRTEELGPSGVANNPMMSFLFMTKAADLKKRYDMAIDVDDPKRHTESYLSIDIQPKTKDDMLEFKKAELVLWKNRTDEKYFDLWMLPARLWFQKTNGDTVMWQFQDMSTTKKLLARDFIAPAPPDKTWISEWLRQPAPRPTIKQTSGGK